MMAGLLPGEQNVIVSFLQIGPSAFSGAFLGSVRRPPHACIPAMAKAATFGPSMDGLNRLRKNSPFS
jgi:hypothetical protein